MHVFISMVCTFVELFGYSCNTFFDKCVRRICIWGVSPFLFVLRTSLRLSRGEAWSKNPSLRLNPTSKRTVLLGATEYLPYLDQRVSPKRRDYARSLGKTGSVVAWPGSNPVFPLRLCHMSEPYSPNIFGELRHMSELCRYGPLCRMSEPNPLLGE